MKRFLRLLKIEKKNRKGVISVDNTLSSKKKRNLIIVAYMRAIGKNMHITYQEYQYCRKRR
jgi:hypothetical protein